MPRVTVLLTCFNHIAYLEACVESVRAQTFRDFEIVAIDDGSTDGSREWLAQQTDVRSIFNSTNVGTYATLNVGLRESSSEFVAILNDDDLWAPTKLELQIAMMDRHPDVGLVHSDGHFIDGSGARVEGSPLGFEFPRTETGDVLLGLAYQNKIIASAALVRRKCFEELGGFNEAYFGSGDWEMWVRVAERWQVGFVEEPLTFYRVHGANASHKLDRIWRDDEKLRSWLGSRLSSLDPGRFPIADVTRAQAHNAACLGTVRTLNGDPVGGRRSYAASIRLAPSRIKSYVRYLATFLPISAFRRLS